MLPTLLQDFQNASRRRTRSWVTVFVLLWLVGTGADWVFRITRFSWHKQIVRPAATEPSQRTADRPSGKQHVVREGLPGDLAGMLQMPKVAAKYMEFHPGVVYSTDADGLANPPDLPSEHAETVAVGASFFLSSGTQTFAQALSKELGKPVYNRARRGSGAFLALRRYVESGRFRQHPPENVVWGLNARDLDGAYFARQSVSNWFRQGREGVGSTETLSFGARLNKENLRPSVLRKAWPNTSALAKAARVFTGRLRYALFREWPRDVRGDVHPVFGPMLFYRENLRVFEQMDPERERASVVATIQNVAEQLSEEGSRLVVLLIPEREQLYREALPQEDQKHLDRMQQLLEEISGSLQHSGVSVVNLLPIFQQQTQLGHRLYWRDDTHWNDAGIHVAAEETARAIRSLRP
ncbi:MAG: hypothetical protein LBN38_03325 [Verrucomicrobiota bacterium]|nr:hypothetical protein [Verrucomicrobiota bacterium]